MMFDDINEVTILGNITNELVPNRLPSGAYVLNFSVATNRSYKKGEKWVKATEFHNIVVFGDRVATINKWANKGDRVIVKGRLQTRSWESDGVKKYKTEIVADHVRLVTPKSERNNQGSGTEFRGVGDNSLTKNTVDIDSLPI